jgi:hypothetical protein
VDRPEHEVVKFEPPDYFFNRFIDTDMGEMPAGEMDGRARAMELVRVMKAQLRDIAVALIGSGNPEDYPGLHYDAQHPLYVVGIDADGNLVGLKSAVVWT